MSSDMNRRHDDPSPAKALAATLLLIAIFLLVGTLDADTQIQIEKAAANPQAHGAEWNQAAQTWDYPEVKTYEF